MTGIRARNLSLMLCLVASTAPAQSGYTPLGDGITLETGDTWSLDGHRFRLYGVQSCLRGTSFTVSPGDTRDCGEASLAVLAAFIRDTRPACAPVAQNTSLSYVLCFSTVGGHSLDLGTILISEGFDFAALDNKGLPVNPAYAVAEQEARSRRAGLWQFADVQHPSVLIGHVATDPGERP
ncbi:thermonuclease family protein [Neorhizobium sp. P12A]|uniref:thermonuclease family protein n=1 Tax=Neorhizobium sp. P12A TaxID=2268027 RepID=UPI0011EF721D|nr:thermonuclease family protein [Neorhizobium sp. P12A]KAA0693754.1 thermonuclease family protein [Neorhizobium sp. P12A]